MSQTRRLAAIVAADVVGYSRLTGADQEGTRRQSSSLPIWWVLILLRN
jgi:class 3 adenylate cyclase